MRAHKLPNPYECRNRMNSHTHQSKCPPQNETHLLQSTYCNRGCDTGNVHVCEVQTCNNEHGAYALQNTLSIVYRGNGVYWPCISLTKFYFGYWRNQIKCLFKFRNQCSVKHLTVAIPLPKMCVGTSYWPNNNDVQRHKGNSSHQEWC